MNKFHSNPIYMVNQHPFTSIHLPKRTGVKLSFFWGGAMIYTIDRLAMVALR